MGSMALFGLAPMLSSFLYVLFPLPLLAYLLLKWRGYRDATAQDPYLGAWVIAGYFRTLALQVVLVGTTLALYAAILLKYGSEAKTGLGLLLGGLPAFLLGRRLTCRRPAAQQALRLYDGFNLVVVGVLAFAALAIAGVVAFHGEWDDLRLPLAALLVYGPSLYCLGRKLGLPAAG